MELSKTFSISTDYKDRKSTPDWETHSFAEIVFIEKQHPGTAPMLYQLKDPKQTISPEGLSNSTSFTFSHDIFFLVGEVESIDRKKKKVYLSNRNTVTYTYLVMASGSKPVLSLQENEFANGLQALIDALKVKPKIPGSFAAYLNPLNPAAILPSKQAHGQTSSDVSPEIDNIVHPTIASANNNRGYELNSINKRLYEVQL